MAPLLDRALIIHANVHDRDQRLTGRYHNTILNTNLNINLHNTNQGSRGPEYISHTNKYYLGTDIVSQVCLKKASTNGDTDRKGEGLLPRASELLLVGWLNPVVRASGALLVIGSCGSVWLRTPSSDRSNRVWGKEVAKQP